MRRRFASMSLYIIVATLMAVCSVGGSIFAAPPAPAVKIGVIFPLTGAAAATGVKLKYAVEVAQEFAAIQLAALRCLPPCLSRK